MAKEVKRSSKGAARLIGAKGSKSSAVGAYRKTGSSVAPKSAKAGARSAAKGQGSTLGKAEKLIERHPSAGVAALGEKQHLPHREEGLGHWLGGTRRLATPIRSDFDVIALGQGGITKASVDELAGHLGITRKTLAEDILDVSVKTMERKGPTEKLDKKISSHALEIARVMEHAYDLFEDEERVRQWLNRENRALQGKKPVVLLDTLTGINLVNNILTRLEEGVYS